MLCMCIFPLNKAEKLIMGSDIEGLCKQAADTLKMTVMGHILI